MATARQIASSTFTQVVGKLFIALLGVATSKMLATYLTVDERGMYELIYGIVAITGIVADMGLYTIAIREMSDTAKDMGKVIGNILSIRTVLCVLSVVVTMSVAFLYPEWWNRGLMFQLGLAFASVSTVFAILNGTVTSVLQAAYQMKQGTISQIVGKSLAVVTMALTMFVFFAKTGTANTVTTDLWGFELLLIGGIVGNIVMFVYTSMQVKKIVPLKYKFDIPYWKELVVTSFPYGLALVFSTLYFQMDKIIIDIMLPSDIADAQIGYYGAPLKIVEIFSILPQYYLNSALPLLATYALSAKLKAGVLIEKSLGFLAMMAFPIVAGGIALAYGIINATNDKIYLSDAATGFWGSDVVLQIMITALAFAFLNALFGYVLVAFKKQYIMIIINGAALLFNIITNIIFIPLYGIYAAAVTTVITELLVLILGYYFARKQVSFRVPYYLLLRTAVAAGIMGVVLWYLKDIIIGAVGNMLGLLILGSIALIIYPAMLWAFRVINKEMFLQLKKPSA